MEWNTPWRNPWNKIKQSPEPQRGGPNPSWGKPPKAVHPHAQRLPEENEKERIVVVGKIPDVARDCASW